MLDPCRRFVSRWLIRYLSAPIGGFLEHSVVDAPLLRTLLRPADIVLVEGKQRFSTAIKYLTQSTWSHAAIYVGQSGVNRRGEAAASELIEADLQHGVTAVPLDKYAGFNIRICRPVGLDAASCARVVAFVVESLGKRYDLKHVLDLARYLIPTPPVPTRWRRRMLTLGSADPTKVICSGLIAEAFQSVKYPILPVRDPNSRDPGPRDDEVLRVRHYSLFTPRDFDLSPYFAVVKPTIELGFNPRRLNWFSVPEKQDDEPTSNVR